MPSGRDIVVDGYDRIAEAYAAARRPPSRRDDKYLDLLLARLPDGAKVLDLGCGSGVPVTRRLAERHEVLGIDVSSRQIELARRQVPRATFERADMTVIRFPDESFDAIVSFFAVFHVPREEHRGLFWNLRRMLKAGGFLLVNIGPDEGVHDETNYFGALMRWSQYGPDWYLKLFGSLGLSIVASSVEAEEFAGAPEAHLYLLLRNGTAGPDGRQSAGSAIP